MYKELIHILLVDDDPGDCRLAKLTLAEVKQPVKFAVQTAESLAECLERLKNNSFDLVLLDLGLPDSQGLATVDRVCEVCPDIPVVVLTCLADEEMGVEAVKRGAGDYLVKNKVFKDLLVRTIRYSLERKKAEEVLRENEERLEVILGSIQTGIVVIDAENHTIVDINPAAAEMICAPREEIIGRVCHQFICPAEAGKCPITDLGQAIDNSECVLLRPDGTEVPVLKTVVPVMLNGRKHLLGCFVDTTERKQTRERLQLFRNLMDRSNDCIFVMEPKQGRFLDVNNKVCASLGYTRKELLDMSIKDIEETIPDDSSWRQRLKELKLKGDIVIEGRHKRKDAATFFVETSLKYVSQKKEGYIIAISRDITERKLAQERQDQLLEEVENANRELKDFAYIVSHDLKAPLRGIETLANWISTDYADKFDEDGREQLDLLLGRVGRMHSLIDGILQYSRVGRIEEGHVEMNLNELVPEIIDMVAPPENIEITVENQLPVLECEKTRIIQVFQNLLSNAVRYIDKPQGRIRIGCTEENDFWKFSVSDNGPGIEEKYFERIFQIFQTLSVRDEVESTGIGLSLVKKIIGMYDGRIWVESKVGEGSTFFFTLPKQETGVKALESVR